MGIMKRSLWLICWGSSILLGQYAYAEMPKYAVCQGFSGQMAEINKGKVQFSDDKILSEIRYTFLYDKQKIVDDIGNEYILFVKDHGLVGVAFWDLADSIITFYPRDEIAIMSKHSDFKSFSTQINMEYTAWTMVGRCAYQF